MNIYADRGNLLLLERRCAWRGIGFEVVAAGLGEGIDPDAHDLFYIGGGQDRDQALCAQDMVDTKRDALHAAADARPRRPRRVRRLPAARPPLRSSATSASPGVGLVDLHTVREAGPRLIGNVAIEVRLPGLDGARVLAGFENHGGRTHLGAGAQPLGRVLKGHGNTGASGFEGVLPRPRHRHLPARPAAAQERVVRGLADRHRARPRRAPGRARGRARGRRARRRAAGGGRLGRGFSRTATPCQRARRSRQSARLAAARFMACGRRGPRTPARRRRTARAPRGTPPGLRRPDRRRQRVALR